MKTLFLILLFFLSLSYNAQSISIEDITSKNILNLTTSNANQSDKLQDYQTISQIKQIGNANTVEVYNRSEKSNIALSQIGNYNTTLFVNAETKSNPQTKVNVTGSNNYIDVTGANSISDKLIINLRSDDKVIFMRNYK